MGTHDPFLIKETLAQTFCAVAAALWLAQKGSRREFSVSSYPLLIPLLIYAAAQIFSAREAAHLPLVFQSLLWLLLLTGLYLALADRLDDSLKGKIAVFILGASFLAALYGGLQRFGIDPFHWAITWDNRPASTFGNPNFAAGWWVMAVPFLAGAALSGRLKWRGAAWGVIALILLNLYWGRTRGAWAAEAAALAIVGAVWVGQKYLKLRPKISFPILLVAGTIALISAFKITADRRADDRSIQERILKWKTAAAMVWNHPVTGVGAGNIKVNFALYQAPVNREMRLPLKGTSEANVHNEYLQVAAESGLLGLLAFLSIFGFWFYRRMKQDEWDPETLGVLGAVTAFLLYSLSNFPFRIVPNACFLILLLAWPEKRVSGQPGLAAARPDNADAFADKMLMVLALGACAALFWKAILPPFRADLIKKSAADAQRAHDFPKAAQLYEKAVQLDFYRSERTAYELGECYRAQNNIPKALEAYKISVSLRNYGEVYNNMGNCYYLLGRFSDAISNWQKAADLGLPDPSAQSQTLKNIETVRRQMPQI